MSATSEASLAHQPSLLVVDAFRGDGHDAHLVAAIQQGKVDPHTAGLRNLDGTCLPEGTKSEVSGPAPRCWRLAWPMPYTPPATSRSPNRLAEVQEAPGITRACSCPAQRAVPR